jgi:molecular chaperone DnaK (HSP70)
MRRLAGGLVSWLTYQQVSLRSKMYSERYVYTPIFELAVARKWQVEHEFQHNGQRIDFVFKNAEGKLIALEIKYIRKNAKKELILDDMKKLEDLNKKKFFARYIMLVAKRESITALAKKSKEKIFTRISKILTSKKGCNRKDDLFGRVYHTSIPEYNNKWCVLVLLIEPGK